MNATFRLVIQIVLIGCIAAIAVGAEKPVRDMTVRLQYREPDAHADPVDQSLDLSLWIRVNPEVVNLDDVDYTIVSDPYGVRYELSTSRYRDGDNVLNAWAWWTRNHIHPRGAAIPLGWYDVGFFDDGGNELASDHIGVLLDEQTPNPRFLTSADKAVYRETLTLVGIPGYSSGVTVNADFRYIPALATADDISIQRLNFDGTPGLRVRFSLTDVRTDDGEIVLVDPSGTIVADSNYIIEERTRRWGLTFTDAVQIVDDSAVITLDLPEDDWNLSKGRSLNEAVAGYVELRSRKVEDVTKTRADVAMWSLSRTVPITNGATEDQ